MIVIIIILIIIVTCLHVFIKFKFSHWSKKGVKGPAPLPFVGNFGSIMMQKQSVYQFTEAIYKQYPEEKVVGLYCGFMPILFLRDPKLISHVMTKDFNNFVNRGIRIAEEGFSNNLLICEDDTWRTIRQKITPAFTTTKLKQMLPLMTEKLKKFIKQVEISTDSENNCDVKGLATRYAMEMICSCGFGINMDFYSDEMQELIKLGKESVSPSLSFRLWYAAEMLIPGIQSMLPAVDPSAHIRAFFIKLVNHVINKRKKLRDERHDIMEVMINLLKENKNKREDTKRNAELNVDVNFIASQVYVLYLTGFESSSTTLSYLLYELAEHDDYQEIAYREICAVLEKHGGNLSYNSINEMSYLRRVLNETHRRHTLVGWLIRKATKDYTFPETNIEVKAGTLILVSSSGLHRDAKYYQYPDVFNPENFSPENMNKIPQCAFIPFGIGPRNCIGLRFATQEIMMAAAAFLFKFKISPCTDLTKKVICDSTSLTLNPVDGIWIKVSKRN